uniref:Cilia- and flagella-associated protein 97 n=1 Tax=Anopheles christyi TaxID=43041 RepID=A0A3F2YTY2_9DIPT
MNSHFHPGRTTPETMVGGLRKWEQLSRTAGKQSLVPFGDGYETLPEKSSKDDSESDQEPTPDDQCTEQHYSESEFHTEQEEDESELGEETARNEQRWTKRFHQIQVSQYPPRTFEQGSHLLHIDIISDELGRFEIPSSGQSRGRRQGTGLGSGGTGRKVAASQQQQQHNISFSRERVREIERTNQILLRRIITTRPTLQTLNSKPVKRTTSTNASPVTSAATNRRKMQEKIAAENEILLRKVNSVGSRVTK